LLRGEEFKVYGDGAYAGQQDLIESKAPLAEHCTNERVRKIDSVPDEKLRRKNRERSKVRARVEHVFAITKWQWRFNKVRYLGLQKSATRAFTALALANIYMFRGLLMGQVRP
jgi:transposase, IS5 family